MRAFLMHPARDLVLPRAIGPHEAALVQDLDLPALFDAMACGDAWLRGVVAKVVLSTTEELDTIAHRQAALADSLAQPAAVRGLYALAVEALEAERKENWGGFNSPGLVLHRSVRLMTILMEHLRRLRAMADRHGPAFRSPAFRTLFATVGRELDDGYFDLVHMHLRRLAFPRGMLVSAGLGVGLRGAGYVLRREAREGTWLQRVLARPPGFSFELHPRDQAGATALSDLRDRGANLVGDALARSVDHVHDFLLALRTELAFYVGCLNLHDRLGAIGATLCRPEVCPHGEARHEAAGLYDVGLALRTARAPVGNDLRADGKRLVFVTGANTGGKSTFLRSVGLAQVMMQCGMCVPASRFRASVHSRVFTHFKREEDAAMESGKFEEEVRRASAIVDALDRRSMVLFNESFASTNEREGAEVAGEVVEALAGKGVRVFFVTHLHALSGALHARHLPWALFLRAGRGGDGRRPFVLTEAPPLPTGYAHDLFRRIFSDGATPGCARPP